MKRRTFTKSGITLTAGSMISPILRSADRKFQLCLNPGAIGVRTTLTETLDFAHRYGFEAMTCNINHLVSMSDSEIDQFGAEMQVKNINWGAGGLPLDFRKDLSTFKEGLYALPRFAVAANRAGLIGLSTWIMPTDNNLTYMENFHQHTSRLREVARILDHFDLRLGLEYVGPRTLMSRDKYPFIGSMREARELIHAIGETNVGLVLDSFHWFCAGESESDILSLHTSEIVTVDLNDAKAGRTYKEQIDNERELPGSSGVIDLKRFLGALVTLGYRGPVRAEPFNKALNEMDNEAAVEKTSLAMKQSAALVE